MKRLASFLSTVLFILMMGGCATPTRMAFEDDAERISSTSKPIYLLTATVKNAYRPSFQPQVRVFYVQVQGAQESTQRLNFVIDPKAKRETDQADTGNTYFLRFGLSPGQYDLVGMLAFSSAFPIRAMYFVPLHATLDVSQPGVYYLGHITATIRERQGDEFKAGPTLPLIDQAGGGASGGSFDIAITDEWTSLEAAFRSRFPGLADVTVKKGILPPFDRAKAQAWWEAH